MLKRLRIQFIAIIMALLTLLLGSVIGLIYHFTRQSLVKESRDMMDSLAASPFQLARLDEASNRVNLPYCMLQVNKYGEILATNGGYYDLSDEDFLQELIAVTYSSTDMQGEIPQYQPPLQPLSAAKRAAPRLCRHHERTGHAPRPAPQQSPARRSPRFCCSSA